MFERQRQQRAQPLKMGPPLECTSCGERGAVVLLLHFRCCASHVRISE